MIIVEGPDLAGKSTLCGILAEHLTQAGLWSPQVHHLGRPNPQFDHYHDYLDLVSRNVVADRFHMSGPCYALVRGESPQPDATRYRLIDAHLRLAGAVTIVLLPSGDLIRDRWREGEMYSQADTLRARDNYEAMLRGALTDEHGIAYQPDYDFAVYGRNCDDPEVIGHTVHEAVGLAAYRRLALRNCEEGR